MHKPQIIFFDIDGTLIDMEKKQVTPLMLDTLHRLQANGIRLAIATGSLQIAHFMQRQIGGRKRKIVHDAANLRHGHGHKIHGWSVFEVLQHGSQFGMNLHHIPC